ncbi:regulator of G-protein signaling 8 isoform X2 [Lonchura striata]
MSDLGAATLPKAPGSRSQPGGRVLYSGSLGQPRPCAAVPRGSGERLRCCCQSLSDHAVGTDPPAERTAQRQNRGMRTRLGCLSHKSDSYNDFTAILPDKPNRALKRLSTEEATRWADSFDVLLSHKYGLAAFRAFLKTEFSEENLEFWLACEDFKKTRSAAKLASKAQRIFEEFIDVQAPREVNIDFQTRELTRRNVQEPSLSCFDQAQGKVHSLMEKDSYPRFLRSKIYTDLLSQTQRRLS